MITQQLRRYFNKRPAPESLLLCPAGRRKRRACWRTHCPPHGVEIRPNVVSWKACPRIAPQRVDMHAASSRSFRPQSADQEGIERRCHIASAAISHRVVGVSRYLAARRTNLEKRTVAATMVLLTVRSSKRSFPRRTRSPYQLLRSRRKPRAVHTNLPHCCTSESSLDKIYRGGANYCGLTGFRSVTLTRIEPEAWSGSPNEARRPRLLSFMGSVE
jgi:hypothetical protein